MDLYKFECKKPSGLGQRHFLAILGFIGFAISYGLRFNISITIVAMVNSSYLSAVRSLVDNTSATFSDDYDVCKNMSNSIHGDTINMSISLNGSPDDPGEFNWNEEVQGFILGSFFWGYIMTQLPGGIIAQRLGGKWPLGIGILTSGLLGLLTPLAARCGPGFLMAVRVGQGLGTGFTVPSAHNIMSKWFPPEERGTLSSLVFAGMPFGAGITMVVSGYISHYLGWEMVFYVTGVITIVWFCLWAYFIHNNPSDHPNISQIELEYIKDRIGAQTMKGSLPIPWKSIIKSGPFWAILIGQTTETWGFYTLIIEIPTYLKTVLYFDLQENSWISAFPHLLTWAVSIVLTQIGDHLLGKRIVKTGTVRKVSTSIALWGSAVMMIGVAYSGCNHMAAIVFLSLAAGCIGGVYGGVLCNHMDISPNFAGILMGLTNTAATIPGFLAPWGAGYIINGNPSLEQWRKVFLLGAIIHLLGNLFYVSFASGEEQVWNRPQIPQQTNMFSYRKERPGMVGYRRNITNTLIMDDTYCVPA